MGNVVMAPADNLFKERTVRELIFLGVFVFSTGVALAAGPERSAIARTGGSAAEDEVLQCRCREESTERRRAQEVHESMP